MGLNRYKDYVKHLVTRVNTINGRKYSEDNTIFGAFPAAFLRMLCMLYVCAVLRCACQLRWHAHTALRQRSFPQGGASRRHNESKALHVASLTPLQR